MPWFPRMGSPVQILLPQKHKQILFPPSFSPRVFFGYHQEGWYLASHSLHFWHGSDTTFKSYCVMNKQEYTIRQNGAPCLIQLIINECTLKKTGTALDISELYFCWNKHDFFILAIYSTMTVQLIAQVFFEHSWTLENAGWPHFPQKR